MQTREPFCSGISSPDHIYVLMALFSPWWLQGIPCLFGVSRPLAHLPSQVSCLDLALLGKRFPLSTTGQGHAFMRSRTPLPGLPQALLLDQRLDLAEGKLSQSSPMSYLVTQGDCMLCSSTISATGVTTEWFIQPSHDHVSWQFPSRSIQRKFGSRERHFYPQRNHPIGCRPTTSSSCFSWLLRCSRPESIVHA